MAESIYLNNLKHGDNPIPAAAIVNGLLESGAVFGTDPETGNLAQTAEEQCALLFDHIRALMEAADSSPDEIVKMTFYVHPTTNRKTINAEWVRIFPDPDRRPARHTQVTEHLPDGMFLQASLTAVLQHSHPSPRLI